MECKECGDTGVIFGGTMFVDCCCVKRKEADHGKCSTVSSGAGSK